MTDDTDDFYTSEMFEELQKAFDPMLGSSFSTSVAADPPEEVQIAIRLVKANHALNEFLDYADEHDIDPTEMTPADWEELDHEEQLLVFSFSSFATAMIRYGEMFDDDDDDNPFKVGDGDDPIY